MTISKVIVVHAFLTSFVQSLPAPAPVVASPVCEGIPVEECHGVLGEYIKKLCPTLCTQWRGFSLDVGGDIIEESTLCNFLTREACLQASLREKCPERCDVAITHFIYDEAKLVVADIKDHDDCKFVPPMSCIGNNSESLKKECPILCGVKDEIVSTVVSAVKETLNENGGALDEGVPTLPAQGKDDLEVCGNTHPKECLGDQKESFRKICPVTCELLAEYLAKKLEMLDEGTSSFPAKVVVSPVCEGMPVEECDGVMGEYIKKLCPTMCSADEWEFNEIGEIVKSVFSAVKEALNENKEALDEVVASPVCEGIPVEECDGDMGEYIKMLCPTLCTADKWELNEKGEIVKSVFSAVKEALNENKEALDEVVASPVCEGIPVEECDGDMGEYIMMLCPTLCTADKWKLNEKGEIVKSVLSAVKEALNENKEALDEVVASPVCEAIPVEECNGVMGEYIKKLCPTMCTADEFESDEIALDSITSVKKDKDHESCLVLELSDCDGDHADLVKKNCPGMCAETAVTIAPFEEVTNYPSCIHLMLHDCWGHNADVVKLNCPLLCASVMGNTLEANKTKGSYRPPSWAWTGDEAQAIGGETVSKGPKTLGDINLPPCEMMSTLTLKFSCSQEYAEFVQAACPEQCAPYVKNLITIIATDEGEHTAAGAVLDEAVATFLKIKQDDPSCIDIGAASCTDTRIKNMCPVKCTSVISIDCATIELCNELLVQMLCPKKCGAEGMPKNL